MRREDAMRPITGFAIYPVLALVAMAAGCRSSEPARLVLSQGVELRGSATTAVNGQFFVKNDRLTCYGSYDGRDVAGVSLTVGRKSPLTVQCSNGKSGTSDDPVWQTGTATIRFKDGSTGSLTLEVP